MVDKEVEDSEVSEMNLAEVSTFKGETPQVVRPEVALNKKLQQEGLQQAKELQQSFAAQQQPISDNRSVAARVLGNAINGALELGSIKTETQGTQEQAKSKQSKAAKESFFDFEEVAKNVLNFIGGVINKAASTGQSDDQLSSLFEQARTGVEKGISLAETELGESLNDDVKEGISASRDAIFNGIDKLENKVFPGIETAALSSSDQSVSSVEASEFFVRTRDGDEVKISFGLKQNVSSSTLNNNEERSANISFRQSQNFSLSITGDLDDSELKAIGDLIAQADDIANTFYRGDVEKAFEDSLNIGFDNKELASFAFQLTQAESFQKVQKYGEVQNYSENVVDLKAPKAVAQYLNKLLDGLDKAQETFETEGDFKTVINSLVNELKDVQVPDILTAINRFHSFNAKLFEGIEPQRIY